VAASYREQIDKLIEGGVDLLLVGTVFDTFNCKAALFAIAEYFAEKEIRLPVMVSDTITDLSGRLLLDPVGIELGNKEIVNTCLDITIKPAAGGACDKDIPDGIGGNTVAISFSTSHTQLTGEEFNSIRAVFGDEDIVNTRPGIAIESPCGGACDEDIPDEISRYFVASGDRTNRAQLAGELLDPARIVFGNEEISGAGQSVAIK